MRLTARRARNRLVACASGSGRVLSMLAELGFIGTIGEDDEVPAEPESDSGDEEEEVGACGRPRRGKRRWAGRPGRSCGPRALPVRTQPSHPGWAESTPAGRVSRASCPARGTVLPSIPPGVGWAVGRQPWVSGHRKKNKSKKTACLTVICLPDMALRMAHGLCSRNPRMLNAKAPCSVCISGCNGEVVPDGLASSIWWSAGRFRRLSDASALRPPTLFFNPPTAESQLDTCSPHLVSTLSRPLLVVSSHSNRVVFLMRSPWNCPLLPTLQLLSCGFQGGSGPVLSTI